MPINNDTLKQQLASRAAAASSGVRGASGGAPPAGGPQGVFDVSNDGVTWHPAVRLRASTGTAFVITNGEATVSAAQLGATEYADQAEFRGSPPPADGTVFRVVSPPGEYRYSTTFGANVADDGLRFLKPNSVNLSSPGRALSTSQIVVTPEMFGAVGDGVVDDSPALDAAFAAVPEGGLIRGLRGKRYYITRGVTIDRTMTVEDIHFYLPNPGTRSVNVVGMSSNWDAMIIAWDGTATRTVTDHVLQKTAGTIEGLVIRRCKFEAGGSLGSPLLAKSAAISLYGTDNCIIEDNEFFNGSREQIVGDGYNKIIVRRNYFHNCNHDGVSLFLTDSEIYDNEFRNVWAAFESGAYRTKIYRNRIITDSAATAGIWLAVNAVDIYHDCEIEDNHIEGPFIYPILTTDSGSTSGASLFLRQIVRRNRIVCGANSGVGTQIVWLQASDGGDIEATDNHIVTDAIASNAGAVWRIEGTETARKMVFKRNTATVPGSYVYSLLQCDNGQNSPIDWESNDTDLKGTGSFRTPNADPSGRTYLGACVFGTPDATKLRLHRNGIGSPVLVDSDASATVLQVGDHSQVQLASTAKTITRIYAQSTGALSNTHATANKTLANGANLVTLSGVDTILCPGESCEYKPQDLAGSGIIITRDDAYSVAKAISPGVVNPYGIWHADHRKTVSGSDVTEWRSLVGGLTLTVQTGDATAPAVGSGWSGGRATVLFDGVHDRLVAAGLLDTRFNGDDTPVSVVVAYRLVSWSTQGTLFALMQNGGSAATALRGDLNSSNGTIAYRVYDGTPISATRASLPAMGSSIIASYRLRADGHLAHDEGGTSTTANAAAATALSNQTSFALGDLAGPASVLPSNVEIRAIGLYSGLTDIQALLIRQAFEAYL